MRECFLVIKASAADMGNRPLTGSFITPDLSVGADGRPKVTIWNLGTREVQGIQTEFAAVPAGLPVTAENRRMIGYGNLANISALSSVVVTCPNPWHKTSFADVLLATVHHPELDPVKAPYDALHDRRVGQMNYAWSGQYEGKWGHCGEKMAIQIRPASQGIYRLKIFQEISGRMPSHPQIDWTMAPHKAVFRWQQHYPAKREDWLLSMPDNNRINITCVVHNLDGSEKADQSLSGLASRV
jgi:hypothetical protein